MGDRIMSVDALVKQIEELPVQQRSELLDRLEKLYGESEEPIELSDEMKVFLDEREAEDESDSHPGYTWDEVVAYVKRKK